MTTALLVCLYSRESQERQGQIVAVSQGLLNSLFPQFTDKPRSTCHL